MARMRSAYARTFFSGIEVTATLDERRGNLFFCSAKLEVGGKLCCRGTLSFALVPIE